MLHMSAREFKTLTDDLQKVAEFRNQLSLGNGEYESHSRLTIKTIGTAKHLLEIMRFVVSDNLISWLKEDGKLKAVELIPSKR